MAAIVQPQRSDPLSKLLPIGGAVAGGMAGGPAGAMTGYSAGGMISGAVQQPQAQQADSGAGSALERYKTKLDDQPINALSNAQVAVAQLPEQQQAVYKPYLDAAMEKAMEASRKAQGVA